MILTQTAAIFVDAYRELNSRKLFWFSLVISALVVAAFAAVGINKQGITLLWWEFPSEINTGLFAPDLLYTFVFATIAIPFWLGWGSMILAIVSTAGMIPDFVAGGSIELTLSKPIGRARLILTKFAAAMLFATLQVTVFTVACFLVIGIRGNSWEPRLLLAIPLIMLVFSYLYSICFLLGLLTRSTIASMLLTLLIWFFIFGINSTEQIFLSVRTTNELRETRLQEMIRDLDEKQAQPESGDTPAAEASTLARRREQLRSTQESGETIRRGHTISLAVKTLLPKTQETLGLLNRALLTPAQRDLITSGGRPPGQPIQIGDDVRIRPRDIQQKIEEEMSKRTVAWVVGTSVGFEVVMIGLGLWHFSRRDF